MNWNARTLVRLFLLVGGTLALVSGVLGGEAMELAIGAVAVVLGATGLVSEWKNASD